MRKYEIMFILDVFDEQKTKQEIKGLLEKYGCNFLKEEDMGMRRLAYKIKKRDNAFYYLVQVELDPLTLKDINSDIKLNEKILKYMATLIKEKGHKKIKKDTKGLKDEPSKEQPPNTGSIKT